MPMSLPLQHFLPLAGWFRVLGNWWKYGLHLTSKVLHLEENKKQNKTSTVRREGQMKPHEVASSLSGENPPLMGTEEMIGQGR